MAWTSPKTWAVGNVLTASEMNTYVRDNTAFLNAPPSTRVYNNAAISVNNTTNTTLTFNTERWDTDTMHNTVTNTSRLTATTAGLYHIYANISWASNATGYRVMTIVLNGATTIANVDQRAVDGAITTHVVSTEYSLAATDYVEVVVYQNSGGALNVAAGANYSPEFGMTYLGTV
jgi:hypothetical protein